MKTMITQIVVGCAVGAVFLMNPIKANAEVVGATGVQGAAVSQSPTTGSGLKSQTRSVTGGGAPYASKARSGAKAQAVSSRPAVQSVDEPFSRAQGPATTTWYVRDDGPNGNGEDWATSFNDLQKALDAAGDGDNIYVGVGGILLRYDWTSIGLTTRDQRPSRLSRPTFTSMAGFSNLGFTTASARR